MFRIRVRAIATRAGIITPVRISAFITPPAGPVPTNTGTLVTGIAPKGGRSRGQRAFHEFRFLQRPIKVHTVLQ